MDRRVSVLCAIVFATLLVGAGGASEGVGAGVGLSPQADLGTDFTYQGYLTDNDEAADGLYDLSFALFDAADDGSQVGSVVEIGDVSVSEGTFSVQLDFGGVFDGTALWLEVGVRPGSSGGAYTTLSPRQALTAAPYALYAQNVAEHDHLGETWMGLDNPLVISGTFGGPGFAPLVLGNNVSDGLRVASAAGNGVRVTVASYGFSVASAYYDGVVVGSAGDYAGSFGGDILVSGNCIGCTLADFGVNASDGTLQPGDVVSIQGVGADEFTNAATLLEVGPAGAGETLVGVVQGWAEEDIQEDEHTGESSVRLVPRDGAVESGGYVTIIIYGVVEVKTEEQVAVGDKLAVGDDGLLRSLQMVEVEGVQIAESAPVLGVVLGASEREGFVWVLVNPQ